MAKVFWVEVPTNKQHPNGPLNYIRDIALFFPRKNIISVTKLQFDLRNERILTHNYWLIQLKSRAFK